MARAGVQSLRSHQQWLDLTPPELAEATDHNDSLGHELNQFLAPANTRQPGMNQNA